MTPSPHASAAQDPALIELESGVRSYSRSWPVVFDRAVGSRLYDTAGRGYLDFFAGAGALNYGHNPSELKRALIEYLSDDRVMHSLDMFTAARNDFISEFRTRILEPRGLDHRLLFPGPGGTNAVEAALKIARKATGRTNVLSFTNAFHGMTLGALAVTGNALKRGGAGIPLTGAVPMPYDGYADGGDFALLERLLADPGSGLDAPAAVIVETLQGEGGLNPARVEWLQRLAELCREHGIVLIVDDVQMGCGRTGSFFSFEEAGIVPDIVCLSKSISGYGIPMALTLVRPELDVFAPGEHNGTFRGVSAGFATAAEAIRQYWSDDTLAADVRRKGERTGVRLAAIAEAHPVIAVRAKGRGLARGIEMSGGEIADAVCAEAFEHGMLVETSGPRGEVVKLLPALTISDAELDEGLDILERAVAAVAGRTLARATASTEPEREEQPA
ncbi:diaminobutyrate--2-oxoglutarate transaminase [Agromyces archimandritae]|uniref:Diaminobutyrate--2-oxoglutarate transaminase n=1 Tax=Agromyces archimandritae TaxID=2781962 RepID=A0A975FL73_9MICO|nr:diaminobutyrate--2-oxoglutarate transaminase [Agromyces archimandritae]QTX04135.1 diaminobutyrate--2-oxoglutarate transaminase [Agromyces archimandritae]